MLKNTKDFTLGADPEFCCINTRGQLVRSSDYTSKNAGFGRDDNQWVFEAHPEPDTEPRNIHANISKIFKDALSHSHFAKWKWISGSSYKNLPFGGHIHFGISNKIISAADACSDYLDHYVGLITLLLEDKAQAIARRKYNLTPGGHEVHYGLASDFREKKYGFEYRTPSSWLSSPKVALGILCLSKVVMYEVVNNRKSFTFDYYAEPSDFSEFNIARVRKLFPRIWNDITRMFLYPEYRSELQYIYDLITKKKNWLDKHEDMRVSWCGFAPTPRVKIKKPVKLPLSDLIYTPQVTTIKSIKAQKSGKNNDDFSFSDDTDDYSNYDGDDIATQYFSSRLKLFKRIDKNPTPRVSKKTTQETERSRFMESLASEFSDYNPYKS